MNDTIDRQKWGIYKATKSLSESHEFSKATSPYRGTTKQVVRILRLLEQSWGSDPSMQSLINKNSFLHEAEESIIALHFLSAWRSKQPDDDDSIQFVAMDVCGGKGIFSLLLQYMNAMFWTESTKPQLDRIILLEKATDKVIDWKHLSHPSADPQRKLVPVEIWQNCNLKELETVTSRMRNIKLPLALTGIHLCKMLSPSLVSIVNQLGPQIRYLCLAPCCMPRVITAKQLSSQKRKLDIFQWEDDTERLSRIEHNKRYESTLRKKRHQGSCYLCHSEDHWLRDCPQRSLQDEAALAQTVKSGAICWICGMPGHVRTECPAESQRIQRRDPPIDSLDVSQVLAAPEPVLFYTKLLATKLNGYATDVVDCPLLSARTVAKRNWNTERKSVFMVAHHNVDGD